jgi:hypothetical protein
VSLQQPLQQPFLEASVSLQQPFFATILAASFLGSLPVLAAALQQLASVYLQSCLCSSLQQAFWAASVLAAVFAASLLGSFCVFAAILFLGSVCVFAAALQQPF